MIDSWARFQEVSRAIADRINDDPSLALAAAANPLLALREIGYDIHPDARSEIEDRLRFTPRALARRRELVEAIYRHAGRRFALDSPTALSDVLQEQLRSGASVKGRTRPGGDAAGSFDARLLAQARERDDAAPDPLEAVRGAHPIVELLLDYRRIERQSRRLASPAVYEKLRRGELRTGVTRIRLRNRAR